MKKILVAVIALTVTVFAQDEISVKVTGDRVSLRAEPDVNAVLLDRAMKGDELVLKDNSNPDWVGVQPPTAIDLWVSGEFVSSNTVLPELLNIRSGPSLSHASVGIAVKGETLDVRGEVDNWLRIAPPTNAVIWISRSYVDAPPPVIVETATVEPMVSKPIVIEPLPGEKPDDPVKPKRKTVVLSAKKEPSVQDIMRSITFPSQKLEPDLSKPQGAVRTYGGVLQPFKGELYKLVDEHFTDIIVCYVRGNKLQMQTLSGMQLEMTGKTYWADGLDLPLVVPSRITPFSVAGR